jgi:hypothetical protein
VTIPEVKFTLSPFLSSKKVFSGFILTLKYTFPFSLSIVASSSIAITCPFKVPYSAWFSPPTARDTSSLLCILGQSLLGISDSIIKASSVAEIVPKRLPP